MAGYFFFDNGHKRYFLNLHQLISITSIFMGFPLLLIHRKQICCKFLNQTKEKLLTCGLPILLKILTHDP